MTRIKGGVSPCLHRQSPVGWGGGVGWSEREWNGSSDGGEVSFWEMKWLARFDSNVGF